MWKDLSEAERKTLIAWAIIGILIFIVAIVVKLTFLPNLKDNKFNEAYQTVKDQNRYYTVNGAITKYYAFLNDKNFESILHILDEKYVKEKGITKENIKNFLTSKDTAISYQPKIMCSKEISSGLTSYLINGKEITMNTNEYIEEKYYEVILDGNHFTFSLKEIDQSVFGGNCHEQS